MKNPSVAIKAKVFKSIKGGKSNKQKKAEKLRLEGQDISVISEDVFYEMAGID